jgi:glycerate kinase
VNIVIAPDSFKGSLTALEAADAIEQGVRDVAPEAETVVVPLADGGEGTTEALVVATRGRMVKREVTGPLGEPVEAVFGVLGDDVTGVVECAQAAGLTLVPPDRRDIMRATTRGVGELMHAALEEGCTRLIVGLGGSATNDGGAGMAQALGAQLLTADGRDIGPGAAGLAELHRISISRLDPRLADVSVCAASDVTNPLCGPEGASAVYGPQKGARPEQVPVLEAALARFAEIVARDLGVEVKGEPGAGAAGGLGAGLLAFCGASIRSGANLVLETFGFDELLEAADLVLTGEGRIDNQTTFGKAIHAVALLAAKHEVPLVAFAGSVQEEPAKLARHGIGGVVPIVDGPMGEEEAMSRAGELLQSAAERAMRLLVLGRELGRGSWWGGDGE